MIKSKAFKMEIVAKYVGASVDHLDRGYGTEGRRRNEEDAEVG